MNRIIKYYCFLVLLISLSFSNDIVAAIASLKGDVKMREDQREKYSSAYKGQMIKSGNWIKTSDGVFVSLIFLDGTNVKIHQKTEIEIKSSRLTSKELKTNMYIAEGEAWSTVSKQGNGEFKIETPTAVASVKGTEFDVNYDFNNSLTTLKVLSGEVEFGNQDIGNILASAMEGSQITKDTKQPSKYKITQEDIPDWKDNINSKWGFNITPNKEGSIPTNKSLKIGIQVKNINDDTMANDFNNSVEIESQNEHMLLSKSNTNWSSNLDIDVNNGKSIFYIKSIKEGSGSIVISSENGESKRLSIDFYQTESQKASNKSKIFELAKNKGYSDIVDAIENMSLESSEIIFGNANMDDIIQKIESNEYEIIKFVFKEENNKVIVELQISPIVN